MVCLFLVLFFSLITRHHIFFYHVKDVVRFICLLVNFLWSLPHGMWLEGGEEKRVSPFNGETTA